MKIAIIGAGFCGLAVAWNLLNCSFLSPSKVHLIDFRGISKGTSSIAVGLLHPYTGAHAKLNWQGQEGFLATQELLTIAAQALKRPVMSKHPGILRLALNDKQYIHFQHSAKQYPNDIEWLDADECQSIAPYCAYAPGLWIKRGLSIYPSLYLQGLWKACAYKGAVFEQRTIHTLTDLQDFDLTIVTTGADTQLLPGLAALPLNLVKGQILELLWPPSVPPLSCALNSHVYLLMSEKQTSCLIGATYERTFETAYTDFKKAEKEILPKAFELFPL